MAKYYGICFLPDRYSVARRQVATLRSLAAFLTDGECVFPRGLLGPRLDGALVQGRLAGSVVRVHVDMPITRSAFRPRIVYRVQVPNAVSGFDVSPGLVRGVGARWMLRTSEIIRRGREGRETGKPDFGDRRRVRRRAARADRLARRRPELAEEIVMIARKPAA